MTEPARRGTRAAAAVAYATCVAVAVWLLVPWPYRIGATAVAGALAGAALPPPGAAAGVVVAYATCVAVVGAIGPRPVHVVAASFGTLAALSLVGVAAGAAAVRASRRRRRRVRPASR